MSSYIDFYIKKYGVYIPIANYSRNNIIYQSFNGAPYGEVLRIQSEVIENARNVAKENIQKYQKDIDDCKSRLCLICDMNNPVDEKLQASYEIYDEIEEYEDMIEDERYVISFCNFLNMIEDSQFGDDDNDCGLYYGVDAGNPMVIEWDKFGRPVKQYKVEVSEEEIDYQTEEK